MKGGSQAIFLIALFFGFTFASSEVQAENASVGKSKPSTSHLKLHRYRHLRPSAKTSGSYSGANYRSRSNSSRAQLRGPNGKKTLRLKSCSKASYSEMCVDKNRKVRGPEVNYSIPGNSGAAESKDPMAHRAVIGPVGGR